MTLREAGSDLTNWVIPVSLKILANNFHAKAAKEVTDLYMRKVRKGHNIASDFNVYWYYIMQKVFLHLLLCKKIWSGFLADFSFFILVYLYYKYV